MVSKSEQFDPTELYQAAARLLSERFYRGSILYCILAVEVFWYRVRFSRPDIMTTYATSRDGQRWLTLAVEEGMMTGKEKPKVDDLYYIRNVHMHGFPYMSTTSKYVTALKRMNLDNVKLARKDEVVASEPVASKVYEWTGRLIKEWEERIRGTAERKCSLCKVSWQEIDMGQHKTTCPNGHEFNLM